MFEETEKNGRANHSLWVSCLGEQGKITSCHPKRRTPVLDNNGIVDCFWGSAYF